MAVKHIYIQIKKPITVCDFCLQKCTGSWLYIYAKSNSNSASIAPRHGRWYIELLTEKISQQRKRGYDICDKCVTSMVEDKLSKLNK